MGIYDSIIKKVHSYKIMGGSGMLLGAAFFANFTASGSKAMISPVIPLVTSDFGVSNSDVGLALTGMWAVFAIVQLPSGILSDKYGEKKVIFAAMISIGVGSLLLSVSPSFAFFFVAVWFLGIGAGLYLISVTSLLTKSFDNVGGTIGIHNAGSAVGSAAVPPVITYIALTYNWRFSLGIISMLAILVIVFINQTKTSQFNNNIGHRKEFSISDVYQLKENRGLMFTAGIATCMYFVFQGVFSFLPTILIEYRNFTAGVASVAFSIVFVIRVFVGPLLGTASEKLGRDYILGRTLAITIIGFLFLLMTGSEVYGVVGVLLIGLGLSNSPVLTSRFMDNLNDDERGTGFGLANTPANILGSLGSAATGFIATASGWPAAIMLLIILLLCAIMFLLLNHTLGLEL